MSPQLDRDRRFAQAEAALEEYFARVAAGEALDFEAWALDHAAIAEELRQLHAMCELLRHRASEPPAGVGSDPRDEIYANGAATGAGALDALRRASNRHGEYEIDPVPIAEGGMGTIFSARDRMLGRSLAIKVLRHPGGASRSSSRRVARFLEEARITSQLNHPGILPIHEIGVDPQGRPYFTMKRIRGQTFERVLERVADGDEQWPQARALDVLQRVCEAVAFAHTHGVIHRDLKPANVMVGDFGEVYVMDWGLARGLAQRDAEPGPRAALDAVCADPELGREDVVASMTQDGEVVGTPAYMAPEQAAGRRDEVGKHSDVYSIGAMLYQLLAARAPYSERGRPATSRQVLERVAIGPPEPLTSIAARAPAELVAICERAMARDWRRRYADVSALSEDLAAFLHGRVVRAHEAGAWTATRKWVKRNKALAITLAVAALFLVGGTATSLLYADRAFRNAQAAERARALADASAELARDNETTAKQRESQAQASERRAKRVTEFVQSALSRADPNQGGAQQLLVTEAMENAVLELESGALGGDPETEASLQATIARILLGNGRPEDALRLAEQSLDTRQQLFGGDHPDLSSSFNDVACCLQAVGRIPEALPMFEAALRGHQRLHDGDHRDTATTLNNVAHCLDVLGRGAEALPMHEAALAMRERLFTGDDADVAQSLNNVGLCLAARGRHAEALPKFQAALAMSQRLQAGDHPIVVTNLCNVATCLNCLGRSAEAVPLFEAALAMSRRLYAQDHPSIAASLSGVASMLGALGRQAEALPMHEEALAMRRRLFDDDHPEIAVSLNNVAACLDSLARPGEALPLFEAALRTNERLYPGDHPNTASSLNAVGSCFDSLGRYAEALPMFEASLQMRQRLFRGDHPDVAASLGDVAWSLEALNRRPEAEQQFRAALDMYERLYPDGHPRVVGCLLRFAMCLEHVGQPDEALLQAERAQALAARVLPERHPTRAACESELQRMRDALAADVATHKAQ